MKSWSLFFGLFLLSVSCRDKKPEADQIFFNAKIWTGDSSNPRATAIAIKDSVIVYVGDDYKPYAGNRTVLTDLGGHMMVPGLIDNHTHFLEGGYYLSSIDLRQVRSKEEFISTFDKYIYSEGTRRSISRLRLDHQ